MESTGNEGVKGGSGWVVWRRLCERVVAEWGGVGVFQGGARRDEPAWCTQSTGGEGPHLGQMPGCTCHWWIYVCGCARD